MNWVLMTARGCLPLTIKSVESLLRQTVETGILVVNQGSKDGTALWLDRNRSDRLLAANFYPAFRSLSEAWNWGLAYLFRNNEHVLVVNNDTVFRQDTYERLLKHQAEKGRHFVSAVSVDNKEQFERGQADFEGERPHPDFSCFLMDKECWERVGLFDRHFRPCYNEDQDYHRRLGLAGIKAISIDLPFLHFRSSTIKDNGKDARRVSKWTRLRQDYYKEKWGALWPDEVYVEPFDGKKHECKICQIR
jgi:GT2 family glycosyltransferase